MQAPRIPENEIHRIAALHATNLLFTPSEERFDRITRLASRLLGTPIALVSLVADQCQWFKSVQGLTQPKRRGRYPFAVTQSSARRHLWSRMQ